MCAELGDITGPATLPCRLGCGVPAGITLSPVPTPRHAWGGVITCPICYRSWMVHEDASQQEEEVSLLMADIFCPTCGERFHREVKYEPKEIDIVTVARADNLLVEEHGRPYLVCKDGHMWTITEVTRIPTLPDKITLGDYLGHED